MTINTNVLYFGDNLELLRNRDYFPDGSVDLIYLDPPFNSRADYNVLFREPTGERSAAQIKAFSDTWHWDTAAERTYQGIISGAPLKVSKAIEALREFIGSNDVMAYLVMMTARLVELHRVLKDTGSLYLHCDPTASHCLKVVLDTIFGPRNFRNEIVWKRQSAHSDARRYGRVHDILFYYSKGDDFTWNLGYQPYDEAYARQYYRYEDADGRRWMSDNLSASGLSGGGYEYEWKGIKRVWRCPRSTMERLEREGKLFYTRNGIPRLKRYLNESKGIPVQDIWADVEALRSWHKERLGYDTQKPQGLLERIIEASSNEEDVVLDPFCGCGTAVVAAQKLGRRWIGIDITHLAITVMRNRLIDSFGLEAGRDYTVVGEPKDVSGARALAKQDRYQFQWWALSLVGALPRDPDRKKGADEGVDGVISFVDDRQGRARRVVVQVKSGHVGVKDIRELRAVVGGENLGLFITLREPTGPMRTEAASAGFHRSPLWEREFPRVQIFTIEQLLNGERPELPESARLSGFARASRVPTERAEQLKNL